MFLKRKNCFLNNIFSLFQYRKIRCYKNFLEVECVCMTLKNGLHKQIISDTPNLAFYICVICKYCLKLLWEDQKVCVQACSKNFYTQVSMDEIYCQYILIYLDCGKYNET